MNILTKRNGIALVAVMAVLLVLTLLLPLMFTMSENAMKTAMSGTNELKASYVARSALEMAVASLSEFYLDAQEGRELYSLTAEEIANKVNSGDLDSVSQADIFKETKDTFDRFAGVGGTPIQLKTSTLYVYTNDKYSDDLSGVTYEAYIKDNAKYSTVPLTGDDVEGYSLFGTAECTLDYERVTEYYEISADGQMSLIDLSEYTALRSAIETAYKNGQDISSLSNCHKIDRDQITIVATATLGEKTYGNMKRKCVVILPTLPSEQGWIKPDAEFEYNQIFIDSSQSTGMLALGYSDAMAASNYDEDNARSQPVYTFSCTGNMLLSADNIQNKNEITRPELLSFGVKPSVNTRDPEADPEFRIFDGTNMNSWVKDARKDNFVMFSASNTIQVDLPIKLYINPCKCNREGDNYLGIPSYDKNRTLYKLLAFQSPEIVFKKEVHNMFSLWRESGAIELISDLFSAGYDAHRITTIMLTAPENTPYSYYNTDRGKNVKAGKVYFLEDCWIYYITYGNDGEADGVLGPTVYYNDNESDGIWRYRLAKAGDVYYFNAEVPTGTNDETTGFSMTGYFMDIIYEDEVKRRNEDSSTGMNLWDRLKEFSFGFGQDLLGMSATYMEDDFHKIGNIYEDNLDEEIPDGSNIYAIWES